MKMKIPLTELALTADDTRQWASEWPCSVLSGRALWAQFDPAGDLMDYTVDGENEIEPPGDEFDAITDDFMHKATIKWVNVKGGK